MAMDGLRGYLQLASGLAEMSKARATEAASALLTLTGGLSSARSGKDVQVQVQDLAEELLAAAAANRRSLISLIRSEIERAMARAPIPPDELDRARAAVAKLSADVEELRAQVMANPAVGEVAARLGLAGHAVTRPATEASWPDSTEAGLVVDTALTDAGPGSAGPDPAPPRRRPPRKQIATQAATRPVPADADTDASQQSAEPRTATGEATKATATTSGPAPKTAAKKSAAKKTSSTKTAAKKAAAKKAAARKTAAKKGASAQTTATKATSATKAGATKATATKGTARKATTKKASATKATAKRAPRSGGSGGSST